MTRKIGTKLLKNNAIKRRTMPRISVTLSPDAHSFLIYLAKKLKSDVSPTLDAFIKKYAEQEMESLQNGGKSGRSN